MNILDGFERRGLFTLTRLLSLLIVSVLLLFAIAGSFWITKTFVSKHETYVDPSTTVTAPNTSQPTEDNSSDSEVAPRPSLNPDVKVPFVVQGLISRPSQKGALFNHIQGLSSSQQQDYVNNLADVVAAAQKQNLPGYQIDEAIDQYYLSKDKRLAEENNRANEEKQLRPYVAGAVFATLSLIALFSLILVLLAIERNTRGVPSSSTGTAGGRL
jgi:hypothetical protein